MNTFAMYAPCFAQFVLFSIRRRDSNFIASWHISTGATIRRSKSHDFCGNNKYFKLLKVNMFLHWAQFEKNFH